MKKLIKYGLSLAAIMLIVVSVASCKKDSSKWEETFSSGVIQIACDDNFKSLMDAEIGVFEAHNPKAVIFPVYTDETEAIRLMTVDSARFVLATRDMTAKERSETERLRLSVKSNIVGFDGIAFIVNQANGTRYLSVEQVKKILSGEITEWSQIDPKLTYGTIRILLDNNKSGTTRYVVDSIIGSLAISPNAQGLGDNLKVLEKVSEMHNTLGIIGVGLISDEKDSVYRIYKDKIKMIGISRAAVATPENSYFPYAGDIAAEKYPYWRPIYVLLSDPQSGLPSGLSIFFAHEIGQKLLMKAGLLPVTDPQNRLVQVVDRVGE